MERGMAAGGNRGFGANQAIVTPLVCEERPARRLAAGSQLNQTLRFLLSRRVPRGARFAVCRYTRYYPQIRHPVAPILQGC